MNVDTLGRRAAGALLATALQDSAGLDTESALKSLHRRQQRRRTIRGVAVAGAIVVALTVVGSHPPWSGADLRHGEASAGFLPLGDGYDVIASSVSPAGTAEAVATYRDGEPAVVLVRIPGSSSFDVAWSAPTPHERGNGNVPFPAAVAWSPDGSRIAVLIGQERGAEDSARDPLDLTLLALNPDGTQRQTVAEVGTCRCTATLPGLRWSANQVEITLPDGPDRGLHTEEMP